MPGIPVALAVDAATFAGMAANSYPDGQRVVITDDSNKEHEARGADGARVWVQISLGSSVTVTDIDSTGATDGQIATADGAGGTTFENPPAGGGSSLIETVNNDDNGLFSVTQGTTWKLDAASGRVSWNPAADVVVGQAVYAVDVNNLPYVEAI